MQKVMLNRRADHSIEILTWKKAKIPIIKEKIKTVKG